MTKVKIVDSGDGEGAKSVSEGGDAPSKGEIVKTEDGTFAVTETTRYASDERDDVVQAEVEEV